jgi:hypothetical protein
MEITARRLIGECQQQGNFPKGKWVCNLDRGSLALRMAESIFEISSASLDVADRRITLMWENRYGGAKRRVWYGHNLTTALYRRNYGLYAAVQQINRSQINVCVDVNQVGLDKFAGFRAHGEIYVLETQPIGRFLGKLVSMHDNAVACCLYSAAFLWLVDSQARAGNPLELFWDVLKRGSMHGLEFRIGESDWPMQDEFVTTCAQSRLELFDPFAREKRYFAHSGDIE